jgi:hypothetical protein
MTIADFKTPPCGTAELVPIRWKSTAPISFRLGRRQGVLVLQGCFQWGEGTTGGYEWRDLPTIDLDAEQAPE